MSPERNIRKFQTKNLCPSLFSFTFLQLNLVYVYEPLFLFMASTTPLMPTHAVNSSTARRHQNSATFPAAIRRMFGTHKKHYNYYSGNSSPVNFYQGFTKSDEVSARKLAAGFWHLRFMEVSGDGSFRSFMSHTEVCHCATLI